jgi:hypothetical protein
MRTMTADNLSREPGQVHREPVSDTSDTGLAIAVPNRGQTLFADGADGVRLLADGVRLLENRSGSGSRWGQTP